MIDLLMVTISFLLITAVWTQLARIDVDAQVPGSERGDAPAPPEKQLHVEVRSPDKFVLRWKIGNATVESIDVPRRDVVTEERGTQVVRFPDLADAVEREWKAKGQHTRTEDPRRDAAILHADDRTDFRDLVGVMDAIRAARRATRVGSRVQAVPAFEMAFSVD
jgi:biopolymer transport protein ExbD